MKATNSSSSSGVHGPLFNPTLEQHSIVLFEVFEEPTAAACGLDDREEDDSDEVKDGFLVCSLSLSSSLCHLINYPFGFVHIVRSGIHKPKV